MAGHLPNTSLHAVFDLTPEVRPNPLQEELARRADPQRTTIVVQPRRCAEPQIESFLPDLVGQRSTHGRHDLHIVLGHFRCFLGTSSPVCHKRSLDSSDASSAVKRAAGKGVTGIFLLFRRRRQNPRGMSPVGLLRRRRIFFAADGGRRGKRVELPRAKLSEDEGFSARVRHTNPIAGEGNSLPFPCCARDGVWP